MPSEIGAKIGIDGEKQFRDSLKAIDSELKTINSRMDNTVEAFEDMADSEEAIAAQSKIFNQAIDAQERKISLINSEYTRAVDKLGDLGKALEQAKKEYGENSIEAGKAQNAYNKQVTSVNRLEQQLNDANTALSRTRKEMEKLGKESHDVSGELGKAEKSIGGISKLAGPVGIAAGAFAGLAAGITSVVEASREYNKIEGSLEVSSKAAGYDAAETQQAYEKLYGVLGDQQQASTALSNLQALGLAQEDLLKLTDSAVGAWAKYGDSIPIDGLAEAINETIRVGAVTGNLADVLNWGDGTGEEAFNELLAQASSEAERAKLVMDELANQGLPALAEGWRENNEELVALNLAESNLNANMADLGTMLTPIVTTFKQGVAELLGGMVQIGEGVREQGAGFLFEYVNGAIDAIPEASGQIADLVVGLTGFLADQAPQFIASGKETLINYANGLIDAIPQMVARLPDIIRNITKFIGDSAPEIIGAGVSITLNIAWGILQAIPELVGLLPELMSAIKDGLGNLMGGMIEAGQDIVKGLWEGIKSSFGWLKDKIMGWADDIIDTVLDAFDINSPSRVFENIGLQLPKGLAVGVDKGIPVSVQSVQGMANDVISGGTVAANAAAERHSVVEGLVNGFGMMANQPIQLVAQLVLPNGMVIAETVFDDLRNLSQQRGVSLA